VFSDTENLIELVIFGSVFGLVFSLWMVYVFVRTLRTSARVEKIGERLGFRDPQRGHERSLSLWLEDGKAMTYVPALLRGRSLFERLERLFRSAGWEKPVVSIVGPLVAACAASVLVFFLLTGSLITGITVAGAVFLVFWLYLGRAINKRRTIFDRQFVDALDLAARSLRAGHPLVGAFQLISEEIEAPIGKVFADICQQQSMGVTLEDALQNTAAASASDDVKLFATSVIIQMRSGGNLASMMERVADVIRERMRLAQRVRVLTAQTQFSKRVLLALPFLIFLVLNLVNPEYMNPLYTTPDGRMMLAVGGLGLLAGAWMMNKMAVVRY
jgi:tight adherence protein B